MEIKRNKIKLWSKLGSRAVFGMVLTELAKERDDFFVLTGDLCQSSGLARFAQDYPQRLINMGIAEQNMIGVAGGMAKDGTTVFATSFSPFVTMRACEQVRMNMGYMQLNIKTVGLGAGLIMSQLGNSHYGIEDVAIMRCIPGITVVSPADCAEIVKSVEAVLDYKGPVYIRLTGGTGNPTVYADDYEFSIGKANILREGKDIAIISSGTMVYQSLKAAEMLMDSGIDSAVVNMHTIKPIDKCCIDSLVDHKLIVTVEEHSVIGGLGSAVAEYLAAKPKKPLQIIIGIEDMFPKAGSYDYLLKQCGLTGEQIANRIMKVVESKN
ncbi:MAG: transketolase [Selenomonadaceae bacterium]|nr:transketolase [Selenomonadaceae bacterium]